MEEVKRKGKKPKFFAVIIGLFLIILICLAPLGRRHVFCYDKSIAHPNIAQMAALLYNKNYPNKKLTAEEINWIMIGAEEEDTPTRWLNHFYDPIHNLGLMFERQHLSAKAWATDSIEQADFALGDQSWPRALVDYHNGCREQAFIELGHTLHLIADMSVPAHTRLDIHVLPGDSYESYVKQNWNEIQKQINPQFIGVISLDQAFDSMANYSNNNFYSDDTINVQNFPSPLNNNSVVVEKNISGVTYKFFLNKNNSVLCFDYKVNDWADEIRMSKDCFINDPFILSNYSNALIPKAVGYSAGVIKLFFDEAEKTAQNNLPENRISLWGWGNGLLGWGINAAEDAKDYLVNLFGGNNQAVSQEPAVIETPPLNLPLKEGETATPVVTTPSPVVKKVLGEKVVTPVVSPVIPSVADRVPPKASAVAQGSLKDGTKEISPLGTLGRNDNEVSNGNGTSSGGGGSYASGGYGGSGSASETPPLTPPQGGGDNGVPMTTPTSTTPTSTLPGADPQDDNATTTPSGDGTPTSTPPTFPPDDTNTTSTTATSTDPGADPCAIAEALCGTRSTPPEGDSATTTPPGADPSSPSQDDTPPSVPIIILEDLGFGVENNLQITVISTDASSSLIWFDLEYFTTTSTSTPSSTWQMIATSSTATIYHFNAGSGQEYTWRARARDSAGNVSDWTPENLYKSKAPWSQQVVINEVAWAGTSSSSPRYANDKWLELYNNTDQDINISGWKLYVGNLAVSTVKITTTTIPAHGYYLMERSSGSSWNSMSSDDTISDIPGDYIFYLDSGKFRLTGERLLLTDASGKIIDEVDCSSGWFTNNIDGLSRTMERIDSRKSGNDPQNWQSSHGPRPVGRGRDGVTIYGSARQSNFGNIVLSGNQLNTTSTIAAVDNPYILSTYNVLPGQVLIVEEGVVIKARYPVSSLRIDGKLEIKGSVEKPVIITSGRDQTFSESKLNTIFGAWAVGSAMARDWQGLWFDPEAKGEIKGLELRYTGYRFQSPHTDHWFGPVVEQSIRVERAVVNISDSKIINNGNTALYLENATTTIQNTNFDNGNRAIGSVDSIVSLDNVKMSNFNNANGPIDIVRSFPSIKNLQLENNQFNGVHLENPIFREDTTLGKELVWSMIYPRILSGGTLRLNPGAKILLPHQGRIEVDGGRLLAIGTPDEPVEIAPLLADDTWGIIHFNNSDSVLQNVHLTNGNNTTNSDEGIITISNSQLKMQNVLMNHLRGAHNIIKSEESQLDLDTVNLGFDVKPGIETTGMDIKNGTLKLRSVKFKNLNFGMFALSSSIPDLDMDSLEALDPGTFENVDNPMFPAYPFWLKLPALPEPPL